MWRFISSASLALASLTFTGCDFRVTNDRPAYAELDPPEQDLVDRVLALLGAFNDDVESYSEYSIAHILDREKIDVSFEGRIFIGNFGDELIHVSAWENLSDAQRDLVQTWFDAPNLQDARRYYEAFFYRFFVIGQGAKQFMYEAHGVAWIYENRSLFAVERNSMAVSLSYFANDRDLLDTIDGGCSRVEERYRDTYGDTYSPDYFREHLVEMVNPLAPTGYMFYACRWIAKEAVNVWMLDDELAWLDALDK